MSYYTLIDYFFRSKTHSTDLCGSGGAGSVVAGNSGSTIEDSLFTVRLESEGSIGLASITSSIRMMMMVMVEVTMTALSIARILGY